MAAFLTDRLLSPRTDSPVSVFSPIPRVRRRRSTDFAETLTTIWREAREWMALLWMLAVVAFYVLMAAGATGLLD
jgi:hypothetical protein